MQINKIIIGLAVVVLGLVSCKKDEVREINSAFFEKKTTVGFYNDAKGIYLFVKGTDQLYFNKATNIFRIVSDDGENYAEVAFDSPISAVGGTVTGTITNHGMGSLESYSAMPFKVLKLENNSYWLWNSQKGLGIIMLALI